MAAIGLAALASTAIRHRLVRQIDAELAALRAEGFAVTLPEAAGKYGFPPPGRLNAADSWRILSKQQHSSYDLGNLPLGAPMSDEVKAAATAYLEMQAPYLALLERALTIEDCHFAYPLMDFWQLGFPEVQAAWLGARLLRMRAALSARTGHLEAAFADIESGLAIGECFADEPIGMVQYATILYDFIALDALQDALHFGTPDEAWLLRVQRRLLAKAESMSLQLVVETDLAAGVVWFDDRDPELISLRHYAVIAMDGPWMRDSRLTSVALFANYLLLTLGPYVEADQLSFVQSKAELLRIVREPMDRWWPDVKDWEDRVASLPGSRVFTKRVHEFWSPPRHFLRHRARLRSAATALAALRYREYCGVPPPDLPALVPEWLDVVPTDPFNGMPMQFHTDASGLCVYSIGPNEIDDGGRTTAGPAADEPLDEGFQVAVPALPEAE